MLFRLQGNVATIKPTLVKGEKFVDVTIRTKISAEEYTGLMRLWTQDVTCTLNNLQASFEDVLPEQER
jgi:hypothetical protein